MPFNVRLALHDTTLPTGGGSDGKGEVGILKNTAIAYSTITLQRRPDLFPKDGFDPSMFEPDRWKAWRPEAWHYIPFSAGPRTCIGQGFAMTEMKYTVIRLLQKIETLEAKMLVDEQYKKSEIIMQPGAGVLVSVGLIEGK